MDNKNNDDEKNEKILNKKFLDKTIFFPIGMMLFSFGLCMNLIDEWHAAVPGTIIGLIGIALLIIVFVFNKNKKRVSKNYKFDLRIIISILLVFISGSLILFGLRNITVDYLNQYDLISGLICCALGGTIAILNYPLFAYFKSHTVSIDIHSRYSIYDLVLLFFIYSFLGWCLEFVLCGVVDNTFANRGFLHIPILPIYGVGAVLVTLLFSNDQKNIFFKGTIIVSILEYLTSFFLELFFHRRWWTYDNVPLNLNGRICLIGCLLFGLGAYLIAKFISPFFNLKLKKINKHTKRSICIVLLTIFLMDFVVSIFFPNSGFGITYN